MPTVLVILIVVVALLVVMNFAGGPGFARRPGRRVTVIEREPPADVVVERAVPRERVVERVVEREYDA